MRRRMMKSKIHRATVTDANLHYVGSITVDPLLLEAADILEYEQVAVVDIDNGSRFKAMYRLKHPHPEIKGYILSRAIPNRLGVCHRLPKGEQSDIAVASLHSKMRRNSEDM